MARKAEVLEVTKYRLSNAWGSKDLRIIGVKCIRKGKALFVNERGLQSYHSKEELYDTPHEAIEARMRAIKREFDAGRNYEGDLSDDMGKCAKILDSLV